MCHKEAILSAVRSVVGEPSFVLAPEVLDTGLELKSALREALRSPIGCPPLSDSVSAAQRVLILVDDITRPTPRQELLPPILDALNATGVIDSGIEMLIALGTHRPMTSDEIRDALGDEVVGRVTVENHDFRDPTQLTHIGRTPAGTPVIVNRRVGEADCVIGVGSIVPHPEAGWSGGAKILQPGVCGEETTAWTHMLAARQPNHLALAGDETNPVRREIEQVALDCGLRFIVNVIFDGSGKVVGLVAGDPVQAHRKGVDIARRIFVRKIRYPTDIVVVDAWPADIDYWQGVKPLAFAVRAVVDGGTLILVGGFSEGLSPIYNSELKACGCMSLNALRDAERAGELTPGVCTEALYLHAAIRKRANVLCVSPGLSPADKEALGFGHVTTIEDGLREALCSGDDEPSVGVIFQGGDVLPELVSRKGSE